MFIIYGMEDQRNNETFYVGVTDDIYRRFLQHLRCDGSNPAKDERIREMREAGYLPLMRTLQIVVDLEQGRKRESYWTRHYYDLGMQLTNQVIPVVQAGVIIVRETGSGLQRPKLKASMTPDEQRAYVFHLLDQGKTRRQILAKTDGYIHQSTANDIMNENAAQAALTNYSGSPAKQQNATSQHPVLLLGESKQEALSRGKRRGKEFTSEQELEFVRLYAQAQSIKSVLTAMHLSYGDYQACASRLVDRRHLKRR